MRHDMSDSCVDHCREMLWEFFTALNWRNFVLSDDSMLNCSLYISTTPNTFFLQVLLHLWCFQNWFAATVQRRYTKTERTFVQKLVVIFMGCNQNSQLPADNFGVIDTAHLEGHMCREWFIRFLMSPVIALVYISFTKQCWTERSSIPVGFNQLERKEKAHLAINAKLRTETRLHLHNRPSQLQDYLVLEGGLIGSSGGDGGGTRKSLLQRLISGAAAYF